MKYYYEANREMLSILYWSVPKSTFGCLNKQECQNRYNKEWAKLKPGFVNGNESDFKRVRLVEAPEALWFQF